LGAAVVGPGLDAHDTRGVVARTAGLLRAGSCVIFLSTARLGPDDVCPVVVRWRELLSRLRGVLVRTLLA
jgi:hypothetical protein